MNTRVRQILHHLLFTTGLGLIAGGLIAHRGKAVAAGLILALAETISRLRPLRPAAHA